MKHVDGLLHVPLFVLVQFSYSIYVSRSRIIKIMTAALTSNNCVKTSQFSAG